jgi:hypothetical protein
LKVLAPMPGVCSRAWWSSASRAWKASSSRGSCPSWSSWFRHSASAASVSTREGRCHDSVSRRASSRVAGAEREDRHPRLATPRLTCRVGRFDPRCGVLVRWRSRHARSSRLGLGEMGKGVTDELSGHGAGRLSVARCVLVELFAHRVREGDCHAVGHRPRSGSWVSRSGARVSRESRRQPGERLGAVEAPVERAVLEHRVERAFWVVE